MMNETKKFLFETDFSTLGQRPSALTIHDLNEAFAKGRAEGEDAARQRYEADTHATLLSIKSSLDQALTSLDVKIARVETEAIALAAELARTYTKAALDRDPTPLITHLVRQAAECAGQTPMLTIFVGPALTQNLRDAIEETIATSGYSGRVHLQDDPALVPGDVRVEWNEGGFRHRRSDLDSAIDHLIESYNAPALEKAS